MELLVVVIAMGVIAVVEGEETKEFLLYNKAVLRMLPPSYYPRVLELLKKAITKYDVTPKYMIVASEIFHPSDKKLIFNTQFVDKDDNLYGSSFSYLDGKISEETEPNRIKDEKITRHIKAGRIDDARKLAAGVVEKAAAILIKGKPTD